MSTTLPQTPPPIKRQYYEPLWSQGYIDDREPIREGDHADYYAPGEPKPLGPCRPFSFFPKLTAQFLSRTQGTITAATASRTCDGAEATTAVGVGRTTPLPCPPSRVTRSLTGTASCGKLRSRMRKEGQGSCKYGRDENG